MKKAIFLKTVFIFVLTFSLFSCSNEDIAVEPTSNSSLKKYSHSTFELELLDLVNQERVSKGLQALVIIEEISYLAATHDDYMIKKGTASHDNFQTRSTILKNELKAISVSENVAFGYNTPNSTLTAWKLSASHKANLEGNHTHFGLAVKADANGSKYYTLLFIRK